MYSKSKLQNAKQKISKLKEKYFNNSNLSTDSDISDFLPSSVLLDNNKPEKGQSRADIKAILPAINELKSPRIEITNNFKDEIHDLENINSVTLNKSPNLIEDHRSFNSSIRSPSEHSNCSKITNKTFKTESNILSDLSNQFENICFLSSSSDDENNTGLHLASLGVSQTGMNLDSSSGLLRTPVISFEGFSKVKQNKDVQKRKWSSSEVSEVQSDVDCTVNSDKESSVNMYSQTVKFEANKSENDVFEKKSGESDKVSKSSSSRAITSMSEKKQTSVSNSNFEPNISVQIQDNNYLTESSNKLKESYSLLNEAKPSKVTTNISTAKKHKHYKTPKFNYYESITNLQHIAGTKLKSSDNSRRVIKKNNRYNKRSTSTDSDVNTPLKEISTMPKKSRRKYLKRSKIDSKHSTSLKPSTNRPVLKSCVLVRHDEYNEEKQMLTQIMSPSKLNGCGHEEVISQLLWNQVQLTRQFIYSHHQMYLMCCQAVKMLSEKHNYHIS